MTDLYDNRETLRWEAEQDALLREDERDSDRLTMERLDESGFEWFTAA